MDKMLKIAVMLTAVDKMSSVIKGAVGESGKELNKLAESQKKLFGSGAALVGTGAAIIASLKPAVDAYASLEDAQTDLKMSLMREGGAVDDTFQKYKDLGNMLGNTLPGDTETFTRMLAALNNKGISSAAVLGGVGEAAANASVLWNMQADDAANFMATVSKATKTAEKDMKSLVDYSNRSKLMGTSADNQMQFFAKVSPAMKTMRLEGIEAVQALSPLMNMFDQNQLKGESAGNAFRKIVQASVDAKKVAKANALGGLDLNFVDKSGNFIQGLEGIGNLYAQIEKLNKLNDQQRKSVIQTLFGDDAETMQALQIMMRGRDEYTKSAAAAAKYATAEQMLAEVKKKLSVALDNLGGNWQNFKAVIGGGVAPAVQKIADLLSDVTAWLQQLFKENPSLAKFVGMFVALSGTALTLWGVVNVVKGLTTAVRFFGIASKLALGPWGWGILFLIAVISMLYAHWDTVVQYTKKAAKWIVEAIGSVVTWVKDNWGKLLLGLVFPIAGIGMLVVAAIKKWFPDLYNAGAEVINGLWEGMKNKFHEMIANVKDMGKQISGAFKDVLGIKSPSRVFMQHGMHITQGAFLGMEKGKSLVQRGAQALGNAMVPQPSMQAIPVRSGGRGGGITVQMNINMAGGGNADTASSFIAELRRNKGEIAKIIQEADAQRQRRAF